MFSIVNIRTGLGPVLSLFRAKDRWTSPLIEARTVPTLMPGARRAPAWHSMQTCTHRPVLDNPASPSRIETFSILNE